MAITNRALDTSEQKKQLNVFAGALATGVTGIAAHIMYPCTLNAVQVAAFGTSGSPTIGLIVNRFIIGTGSTAFALGTSQALVAYGTSGVLGVTSQSGAISGGYSLTVGGTLLNLLPNDVLMYITAGANSAVTGLSVAMVVTPIQDVKTELAGIA
jgi:hypothetical protein